MLQSRRQKQIPERLSHFTSIEAAMSILSDIKEKGICLWAFSNRYKNDDQEIRMGEYMLKRVLKVLPGSSLLHTFGGYENSASISFMEGEVNLHMLEEYGNIRLEFDLRGLGVGILSDGLIDCEYVSENELEEYADEYCEMISGTFNSIPALQKKFGKLSTPPITNLVSFFMMEHDLMQKVFCLKEQKWSNEMEWRKVFPLKADDDSIQYLKERPYVEYYLDKELLTGITIFCLNETLDKAQNDANTIKIFIAERGYKAKVRIETIQNLLTEQ